MSYYEPLQRPKYEYRRRLPHYQNASGALFVTFGTFGRFILSDSARDQMMRHCTHDNGKHPSFSRCSHARPRASAFLGPA